MKKMVSRGNSSLVTPIYNLQVGYYAYDGEDKKHKIRIYCGFPIVAPY